MPESDDPNVLAFIGVYGKTFEQIEERFPRFDLQRVLRAGLVEIARIETPSDVEAHRFTDKYVLTERGASAVGLEPNQPCVGASKTGATATSSSSPDGPG